MLSRLIPYNLYKVNLSKAINKLSAKLAFTKTDFSCAITTNISKSAINALFDIID